MVRLVIAEIGITEVETSKNGRKTAGPCLVEQDLSAREYWCLSTFSHSTAHWKVACVKCEEASNAVSSHWLYRQFGKKMFDPLPSKSAS